MNYVEVNNLYKSFAEKVLFMNIIEQSSGAEACLYITNVEFGDTITVNAIWNNEFAAADVMRNTMSAGPRRKKITRSCRIQRLMT